MIKGLWLLVEMRIVAGVPRENQKRVNPTVGYSFARAFGRMEIVL